MPDGLWVSFGHWVLFLAALLVLLVYFMLPLNQKSIQLLIFTLSFFEFLQRWWKALNRYRQLAGMWSLFWSFVPVISVALGMISSYILPWTERPPIWCKSQREIENSQIEVCRVFVVEHQSSKKALITLPWWSYKNKDAKTASYILAYFKTLRFRLRTSSGHSQ